MRVFWIIISALLVSLPFSSFSSDLAKEKRWIEQIEDSLLDGEPVFLNDGQSEFFTIDTAPSGKTDSAVILLHGTGAHPDWPQVIHPLRVQLPESGWRTLSLQLPILDNEASGIEYLGIMKEAAPRIAAGVVYLKQSGIKHIVIIAHSLGTEMSSEYLLKADASVKGFVGIGMGGATAEYLGKLKMPVLDLYGEQDLDAVIQSAPARLTSTSQNPNYKQIKAPKADHFFAGEETQLIDLISTWLKSLKSVNR